MLRNQPEETGSLKTIICTMGFLFMLDAKVSLRQYYRSLRRQLSDEQKILASQRLPTLFSQSFLCQKKNIAVYLACDAEISLYYLIETLWQRQYSVFLPMLDKENYQLCFGQYIESSIMKKNQYGIDEPENDLFYINPEDLDVVLVPLVAFDEAGVRLGMGKGYYDRTFSFRCHQLVKPLLIGVAYQCQQCKILPKDEWDVPLDGVLTEKALTMFSEAL